MFVEAGGLDRFAVGGPTVAGQCHESDAGVSGSLRIFSATW